MAIRTLILDFGNVIGYFDHRRATARLADETGLPEPFWRRHLVDPALEDEYESGRLTSAQFLAHVLQRTGATLSNAYLQQVYADIFWPNEDVCALVARLHGRYRLLLGSNTTELHAVRFREQFADTLRLFDRLILSYEVGTRKPKAAFFEECVRWSGGPADECVFIDDLHANVAGARACGLHGIVYQTFPDLLRQLAELGVDC
jgi:HAD superfamily hydrolase (TIGR01509 family)